jgi:hypothetical protein
MSALMPCPAQAAKLVLNPAAGVTLRQSSIAQTKSLMEFLLSWYICAPHHLQAEGKAKELNETVLSSHEHTLY